MQDYYGILGVKADASKTAITKAFRKLAQKHHPDRGGDEAEFKKINEAYDTLKDKEKRADYDNARKFGYQPNNHTGQGQAHATDPGGFRVYRTASGFPFEGGPDGIEEIFSTVFGQGFARQAVNRNITLNYEISIEDAYRGLERQLNINLPSGIARSVNVTIPAGVKTGSKIKFRGLGDNSFPSSPAGDLIIVVNVKDTGKWSREKDDLITTIKLDMFDAATGCEARVRHLDGKVLSVKIPSGTQPGAKIRLKGKGMASTRTKGSGSLVLVIDIEVPKNLTQKQIEMLKAIKDMR